MSSKRHFVFAVAAALLVFAAGFGFLVWPSMARIAEVSADIEELDHKNRTLEERTAMIRDLNEELEGARARAARTLKPIPSKPEISELVRQLSMPVDGHLVADQTFTSSPSKEAALDEDVTARAMPLTVDLVARYDAIREIIERAESSDRLVRIAFLRISRHPDKSNLETDDEAMLAASIKLEAIYIPPGGDTAP